MSTGSIQSVLNETRVFNPPAEFAKAAHVSSMEQYQQIWDEAKADPDQFWSKVGTDMIDWFQPFEKTLDWSNAPFAEWYIGGKLNAAYNCIDRHANGQRKNKAAIIWEGEPGERRVLRYQDLLRATSKFANVLKKLGVKKGDTVAIYMPLIPELVFACLACARFKTQAQPSWSQPMAAIAEAKSFPSKRMPMPPPHSAHRSKKSWS